MYGLLARIPEGLEPLRKRFEDHVRRAGLAAIEKLTAKPDAAAAGGAAAVGEDEADEGEEGGGGGGAGKKGEAAFQPKAYIEALLEVHKKNLEVVNASFRGEAGFVASLDKACKDYVNANAATKSADGSQSSSKSPEFLARHTDALLKKTNRAGEAADLEEGLNQVVRPDLRLLSRPCLISLADVRPPCSLDPSQMAIFKYLEDKDVFQKFYSKMLSRRLISAQSLSDEAEASMITKLKEAAGFEYTSKLQRMFTGASPVGCQRVARPLEAKS